MVAAAGVGTACCRTLVAARDPARGVGFRPGGLRTRSPLLPLESVSQDARVSHRVEPRDMRRWSILVCTTALAGLALAGRAGAATFTVTNTNNSGTGSLREAVQGANATGAADTITFAIPGAGAHTISVTTPLPAIVHPLVINGQSQPGYNGAPLVQLDNGG